MAFLVARFAVPDFETWKRESLDADLVGRKQLAKGHRLYRGVRNQNEIFLMVEFSSPEEARSFRTTLSAPGALELAFGAGIDSAHTWIAHEVEAASFGTPPRRRRRGLLRRKRR